MAEYLIDRSQSLDDKAAEYSRTIKRIDARRQRWRDETKELHGKIQMKMQGNYN